MADNPLPRSPSNQSGLTPDVGDSLPSLEELRPDQGAGVIAPYHFKPIEVRPGCLGGAADKDNRVKPWEQCHQVRYLAPSVGLFLARQVAGVVPPGDEVPQYGVAARDSGGDQKAVRCLGRGVIVVAADETEPPRATSVFGPGFSKRNNIRASIPPSQGSNSGTQAPGRERNCSV